MAVSFAKLPELLCSGPINASPSSVRRLCPVSLVPSQSVCGVPVLLVPRPDCDRMVPSRRRYSGQHYQRGGDFSADRIRAAASVTRLSVSWPRHPPSPPKPAGGSLGHGPRRGCVCVSLRRGRHVLHVPVATLCLCLWPQDHPAVARLTTRPLPKVM